MLALLTALILTPGAIPRDEAARGESGRLQGTWLMVRSEVNGMRNEPVNETVTFEGDTMTWRNPVSSFAKTFRLRPDRKPREIDFTSTSEETRGKHAYGIYEWDGNTLRICMDAQERPKDFKTRPEPNPQGRKTILWVLKRKDR